MCVQLKRNAASSLQQMKEFSFILASAVGKKLFKFLFQEKNRSLKCCASHVIKGLHSDIAQGQN